MTRTVRALAVLLVTLLWVEMVSWTDAAGYAYAVGIYVLFVTRLLFLVLLCQVVVVGVSAIRGVVNRWRHAA